GPGGRPPSEAGGGPPGAGRREGGGGAARPSTRALAGEPARPPAIPASPASRRTATGSVASCRTTRSGATALITRAITSTRPRPPRLMLYVRRRNVTPRPV